MKPARLLAAALLIAASFSTLQLAQAQMPGIGRTDVLKHDLGDSAREVVQARVDIAPGLVAPNHSHPGEEIAYVLEGTLEYRLEGKPPVTLNAGEALFIPSGAKHSATNVGSVKAVELATYIVSKGKPLVVLAK
jgi:quercetin dioxygenase-like cupin family protein